jgi:hypothetical protein
MPCTRATAGAPTRRGVAILLLAILAAPGCSGSRWIPGRPRAEASPPPRDFVPLYPKQPHRAELDCPSVSCQTRYRIQLQAPGELRIEVVPSLSGDTVGMRVVLEDFAGEVLEEKRAAGESSLELKREVEAGSHVVLVQVTEGRVGYELTASIAREAEITPPRIGTLGRPAPETRPSPPVNRVDDNTPVLGSNSAYNPRVDFSRYRRFAFSERPEEKLQGAPGASVGNPFVEAEVQRAIRSELIRRGFIQTPEAEADFLVSAHVGAQSQTWYAIDHTRYSGSYDHWFNRWGTSGAQLRAHTYRDGTLVIDIIDVSRKELTWHGWAIQPIPPATDGKALIRKAVAKVLDQFPPR